MMIRKEDAREQNFDWGRLTWYVSGEQGSSTTMTIGRGVIDAGRENPRHIHPNCDEVLHLLSGSIVHSIGNEHFTMQAGDSISIPAGIAHNARATSEEPAVMMIAFSSAVREFVLEV